jgi:hypothetical protein
MANSPCESSVRLLQYRKGHGEPTPSIPLVVAPKSRALFADHHRTDGLRFPHLPIFSALRE